MAPEAVPIVVVPEAHPRKLVKEVVKIPIVSSVTQKVKMKVVCGASDKSLRDSYAGGIYLLEKWVELNFT